MGKKIQKKTLYDPLLTSSSRRSPHCYPLKPPLFLVSLWFIVYYRCNNFELCTEQWGPPHEMNLFWKTRFNTCIGFVICGRAERKAGFPVWFICCIVIFVSITYNWFGGLKNPEGIICYNVFFIIICYQSSCRMCNSHSAMFWKESVITHDHSID